MPTNYVELKVRGNLFHFWTTDRQLRETDTGDTNFLQMTTRGCMMIMIRKLSSNDYNGRHQPPRAQKRYSKFEAMWSQWWYFFFQHSRYCPQGICSDWSNSKRQILLWRFETVKREYEAQTPWNEAHQRCADHKSSIVRQFLTRNNMITVPHSPHSPELVPRDFSLFPEMKLQLIGQGILWKNYRGNHKI